MSEQLPLTGPTHAELVLRACRWLTAKCRCGVVYAEACKNIGIEQPDALGFKNGVSHEHIFLFAKSRRYYYDAAAVAEPLSSARDATRRAAERAFSRRRATAPAARQGEAHIRERALTHRNRRDVWTIPSQPFHGEHFATFPEKLVEPCVLAGCPRGGVVLDPFGGSGRTALVANRLGRDAILIELNPEYAAMARDLVGGR